MHVGPGEAVSADGIGLGAFMGHRRGKEGKGRMTWEGMSGCNHPPPRCPLPFHPSPLLCPLAAPLPHPNLILPTWGRSPMCPCGGPQDRETHNTLIIL